MERRIFNLREFRNSLARFATGVTVVTALQNRKVHGMTANAFVSVSLNPPLVLVSLDNHSHMHRILPEIGRYGISVLAEHQKALSDHFAGRPAEQGNIRFIDRGGAALLDGAVAHFIVKVMNVHPAGDHTLYVGLVEHFQFRDDKPLVFYAGGYQQLRTRRYNGGKDQADFEFANDLTRQTLEKPGATCLSGRTTKYHVRHEGRGLGRIEVRRKKDEDESTI